MPIALVSHVTAAALNTFTTGAIDTTGASLLVVEVSYSTAPVVSDSKANVWTGLTVQTVAGASTRLYYVANPIVGAGHTFTATNANIAAVLSAAAFSGVVIVTPFDQQNGTNAGAGSTLQPGSVTPTTGGQLIVTSCGVVNGAAPTIDSGFSIADATAFSGGVNEGGGLAYLVQTTAAAVNPTWSSVGGTIQTAAIATFKATSTGMMMIF